MSASHSTPRDKAPAVDPAELEEMIASLAKRHRVSQAIVREIARKLEAPERSAIEREIARGKSRR